MTIGRAADQCELVVAASQRFRAPRPVVRAAEAREVDGSGSAGGTTFAHGGGFAGGTR